MDVDLEMSLWLTKAESLGPPTRLEASRGCRRLATSRQ